MADPLDLLSRRHKTPTKGNGNNKRMLPVREPTDNEQAMFDELTGNDSSLISSLLSSRPRTAVSPNASPARPSSTTSRVSAVSRPSTASQRDSDPENDLVAQMARRLRSVERQLQLARAELDDRDRTISKLRKKTRELELHVQSQKSQSGIKELHAEYSRLQKQVHDMEMFLADYGLVWIGDDEAYSDSDDTGDSAPATPTRTVSTQDKAAGDADETLVDSSDRASTPTPRRDSSQWPQPDFVINYDKIIENVGELNVLAGEGVKRAVLCADGSTQLKEPEPVRLTLFRNGMMLYDGPFRPTSDATVQMCLRDLMDGYFPWEMKQQHPDGIPLLVVDKRNEDYAKPQPMRVFTGSGHTLGGEQRDESRLLEEATSPKRGTSSRSVPQASHQHHRHSAGTMALLSRLPTSVVRGGKIVGIRDTLGEHLGIQTTDGHRVVVVNTPVAMFLKNQAESQDRPATPADIASIQVRNPRNRTTYILKMRFTDTVGDLRTQLLPHCSGQVKLVTTYPRKTLQEDGETLEAAGLTPTSTILIG